MSEYQYTGFLAIDRPLSAEAMAQLRTLSSRATITPTGFVNEYHWGDPHFDAAELMRRFFDMHVYLNSWGDALCMIRLPRSAVDADTISAFHVPGRLDCEALPEHWLLTWTSGGDEPDYDRFSPDDGPDWQARLAPLREELLLGDFRALALGWLGAVVDDRAETDDRDEAELLEPMPLRPGPATAAQRALAAFLGLDEDLAIALLEGDGQADADDRRSEDRADADLDAWLEDWSRSQDRTSIRAFARQMLEGRGLEIERTLKRDFAAWREARLTSPPAARRGLAELRVQAEQVRKRRLAAEARVRAEEQARIRQERDARLALLAADFPKAWRTAHAEAERGSASGYDAACRLVLDLRDAYQRHASSAAFRTAFASFLAAHPRRPALLRRLTQAGLQPPRTL